MLPRLRENILLNFEFKSEAIRANLQENKRILKWRPFWNKVYYGDSRINGFSFKITCGRFAEPGAA